MIKYKLNVKLILETYPSVEAFFVTGKLCSEIEPNVTIPIKWNEYVDDHRIIICDEGDRLHYIFVKPFLLDIFPDKLEKVLDEEI